MYAYISVSRKDYIKAQKTFKKVKIEKSIMQGNYIRASNEINAWRDSQKDKWSHVIGVIADYKMDGSFVSPFQINLCGFENDAEHINCLTCVS